MTAIAFAFVVQALFVETPRQPATPARDARQPAGATATVRGRVTDKETGQPLRRMRVQLSGLAFAAPPRLLEATRTHVAR